MTPVSATLTIIATWLTQTGTWTAAPDSESMLHAARAAQEHFERVRREQLSWIDPEWGRQCDEVRNFYCYTYGDPDDRWKPPRENEEVATARDSLVDVLRRVALQIPGDRWIAGQRVRYLVEAGEAAAARSAAGDCRPATGWWCLALAGYGAHAAEDFAAAEAEFDRALAAMPPEQRCDWLDISLLLPNAPARLYRSLPCEDRTGVERRFWWMADPLFLTSGNERRSEHFARHVYLQLEDDAPAVSPRKAWFNASGPWVVRYGRPTGWERERSRSMAPDPEPLIVTHFPEPSQVFEPGWKVLEQPESLTVAWPFRPERARTGYIPGYAEPFDALREQIAVFHRGDSAVVLAAYGFSSDSVPAYAPVEAGLFLSANEHEAPSVTRTAQSADGVVTLAAPPRSGVLSVEVRAPDRRRAGRTRYWLRLQPLDSGRIAVSDLLLLTRSDSLPRTLVEAARLARFSTSVPFNTALGLYWEVYGLGPGSVPASISLTLVKEGRSWLGRAARSLGLGRDARPAVSLKWDEFSRAGSDLTSGTIALDLARNDPGRYSLHLEVTSPGRGTASAEREITIARLRP